LLPGAGEAGDEGEAAAAVGLPSPLFLPERRIEEAFRDAARLPSALTTPLAGAVRAVAERASRVEREASGPVPVRPGSLGRWTGEAEAAGGS
ncbi:MAG: hypothetical protein ACRD2W_23340, partial [Acidimicrobiales bacterium]